MSLAMFCVFGLVCVSAVAQVEAGPLTTALPPSLPEARDQLFRGEIELHVDATDTVRGLFRASETIPIQSRGDIVLFYPEREPANHGPTASAVELAGLRMQIDGQDIEWKRSCLPSFQSLTRLAKNYWGPLDSNKHFCSLSTSFGVL